MTIDELVAQLERRAAEAEREGATAPVANLYRVVLDHLRLVNGSSAGNGQGEIPDRLLTVGVVAGRLGVTAKYVYDHARGWPFTRRLGRKLRFSEAGLRRWLERRG